MPDTSYKETDQDVKNNPAEQASLDQYGAEMRDHLNDAENAAAGEGVDDSDKPFSVGDKEKQAGNSKNSGFYTDVSTPGQKLGKSKQKKGLKGSRKRAVGWITGAGVGGGAAILIMFSMLPLKLESIIQNIVSRTGAIPGQVVGDRLEHVVTRWIATRALQVSNSDNSISFCANGGVLCHLGQTSYNDWFNKRLGGTDFQLVDGHVNVTLNAQGRTGLGGKASSFTLEKSALVVDDFGDVSKVVNTIDRPSNKEVKRMIREMTKEVHGRNYLMRYVSKRVLMSVYGIRRFNVAVEKRQSLAKWKTEMGAKMLTNTVGRISNRMAAYLGCLNGASALGCQESLKKLNASADDAVRSAQEEYDKYADLPDDDIDKQNAKGRLDAKQGAKDILSNTSSKITGEVGGEVADFLAKEILKKALQGGAVVGLLDIVFSIIGAVDNGALEVIRKDMVISSYVSTVFDEDFSPVVTNDKMKAGDMDLEQLGAVSSMYDGMEKAPLFAAINGGITKLGTINTTCTVSGERKVITLPEGELVCPEQKIVNNVGGDFKEQFWWEALAGAASVWNNTIGNIVGFFHTLTAPITEPLGNLVAGAAKFTGKALWATIGAIPGLGDFARKGAEFGESAINYLMERVFYPPNSGPTATGSENYVATKGALLETSNSSMEYGQNSGDNLIGAGGVPLDSTQISQILKKTNQQEYDEFQEKTLWAKLFDTSSKFSVAHQLIAKTPTSTSSLLGFVANTPSTILSGFSARKASAEDSANIDTAILQSMGLPIYGYPDSSELKADPSKYTPEFCEASAKERNESFGMNGYLIPTYSKTDPCALEKIVGGIIATDAGFTDDPNYIQEPDSGTDTSSGNTEGSFALPEGASKNWSRPNTGSQVINANYRSIAYFNALDFDHVGVDLNNTLGGDVLSACDGVVEEVNTTPNLSNVALTTSNAFVINCGGGIQITNSHTKNVNNLSKGSKVTAGSKIGETDLSGVTSGAHVHFGVKIDGSWTDPVVFMKQQNIDLGTCSGEYCAQH